jgi:hypothetical protein
MSALAETVTNVRPFVPAKNFELSKRYYLDLGFKIIIDSQDLAGLAIGSHSFLLQNFYVKEFADNYMMHMLVTDVEAWWTHVQTLKLQEKYEVPAPKPPKDEPWGLRILYLVDPTGVLWHVAQPIKK